MTRAESWKLAGLGLVAGAVLFGPAAGLQAQVVPPPASEVPIEPAPPADTARTPGDTLPPPGRDTVKAPFGRAYHPAGMSLAPRYVWEGDQILASGAYTLADLLHQVPEITVFRSGWIHSQQYASFAGDLSRIRVFLDGIELDAISPREFGMLELSKIPLWLLERVAVERAGTEVRVHLRSWSVERTTPYTRTDVYTGMENTDIYRGYYGKRFGNGGILQAAGQQAATENRRLGGGGDGLSLMLRTGFGWRLFSIDGFAQRSTENRTEQFAIAGVPPIPAYRATNTDAYLRAAAGRSDRGPWLELIAASYSVKTAATADFEVPRDTMDRTISRVQYVASTGIRAGPFALSLTDRLRRYEDSSYNAVAGRLEMLTRVVEASAYAEQGTDFRVTDATIRLQPIRFFAISGNASQLRLRGGAEEEQRDTLRNTVIRGEAGLNLGGIWLYAGSLALDAGIPVPVSPFEEGRGTFMPPIVPADTGKTRRTARIVGLRGIGWRGLGANTHVIRWTDPGLYVPEYQARTELNFQTPWLSKFPRGEFNFRLAVADEFRSAVQFTEDTRAGASHILSALMEIRILRATLTFQTRNPLGRQYFIVPGYEMPRTVSTYGVRWYFWD